MFILLILASASKARHRLLQEVGIEHLVIVSDVDEKLFDQEDVHELVKSLAKAKAKSSSYKFSQLLKTNDTLQMTNYVLGCDSLFEFKDRIFGKPKDEDEAVSRLKEMSSNFGYLHTGHCLLNTDFSNGNIDRDLFKKIQIKVVTTKITFSNISHEEIKEYVSTGEPYQSAGGFNLEGKGGLFIQSIEGCYSNVIGLSLPWLRMALLKT